MSANRVSSLALWAALFASLLLGGGLLLAQIEGPERGVAPRAATGDFEVTGIEVDVTGDDAFDARQKGWEEAQRKAWTKLYARSHGGAKSTLPDTTLNNIVSAIVVEQEQIGVKRYRARLGVIFDRARAGQYLGVGSRALRSPPLLVLPVQWTGGAALVFEQQTEWQRAWARYNAGESPIDYVRPYGTDAESLVLTAGQANQSNRRWWRTLLDQFGAANVIIPVARLEFEYPGGPVIGRFAARYGPDNRYIGGFTLRVANSDGLDDMFDAAVVRIDRLYARALSQGLLKSDQSLQIDNFDFEALEEEIAAEIEAIERSGGLPPDMAGGSGSDAASAGDGSDSASTGAMSSISIQYDTPDVGAVSRGESSLRSVPGISSASTTSLALGGVSVMQVRYNGDIGALAAALRSRGWTVQQGSGALRIRRGGSAPTAQPQGGDGDVQDD